jgi:hypothetical protein
MAIPSPPVDFRKWGNHGKAHWDVKKYVTLVHTQLLQKDEKDVKKEHMSLWPMNNWKKK